MSAARHDTRTAVIHAHRSLKTQQATRKKLTKYEQRAERLKLKGAVETAKRGLNQVLNDNEAQTAQALASKEEATQSENKEQERLKRLEAQLDRCKIIAPHDGMVVYVRERRSPEIAEGVGRPRTAATD